jgi:hypothetical protein
VAGGLSYLPSVEARTAEVAESLLVAAERLMEVSGIGGALEAGDLSPGDRPLKGIWLPSVYMHGKYAMFITLLGGDVPRLRRLESDMHVRGPHPAPG